MRNFIKFKCILLATILVASCSSDDDTPTVPEDAIQGTWMITSSVLLGATVPGDGSSLTFNACDTTCSGADYLASDQTTGSFTYSFNDDFTQLTIVDASEDGGSYDGTWEILELKSSTLRIIVDTGLLGTVQLNMSK